MGYVVGIDGGGTKTTCVFQHIEDQTKYELTGEGTNPHVAGFPGATAAILALLLSGMKKFHITPKNIKAFCCGLAGVGRKDEEEKVLKELAFALSQIGMGHVNVSIYSDTYIALRGALNPDDEEGIIVIAGTGSCALGQSKSGKRYKAGGFGHLLGDEGSGYDIALQALRYITRSHDQRESPTLLTSNLLKELGLTRVEELIGFVYDANTKKQHIAQLAKVVQQVAKKGDQVAEIILRNAAFELALLVEGLFKQCKTFTKDTPVMLAGSIFNHFPIITTEFLQYIERKNLGSYRQSKGTPVEGAVLLAKESIES